MPDKRLLFLSQELSGYWVSGIEELRKLANVLVIHYPTNKEAPFKQSLDSAYQIKPQSELELIKILDEFDPNALFVSGWADKEYKSIAQKFVAQIPVVLCIDNPWKSTWKQWINVALSIRLRKCYNRTWGCGPSQAKYLKKLGFNSFKQGLYTANVELFDSPSNPFHGNSTHLVCVARYIPQKNLQTLWKAFIRLSNDFPNWELHCFGFGVEWDSRIRHDKIIHHGFTQPKELSAMIENAAAFVLPSLEEHWGVVVHEMAVSGLPLLLSENVEARHSFLNEGENGFMFNPRDEHSIELCLRKFIELSAEEKMQMGQKSRALGLRYNPNKWAGIALSFLK